ncbi:YraN family protein [Candidatus Falkowbacteria bacterium]|nr:YraN family protein [Candidatus Falkowbacteria bacterium]
MEDSYNKAVGGWGEALAGNFLRKRGYTIIANNVRASFKEVDLVCWQEKILVFVEVKTRIGDSLGAAIDMIGEKKILNLKQAAISYVLRHKPKFEAIRIDFIAIDADRKKRTVKIRHYKDIS